MNESFSPIIATKTSIPPSPMKDLQGFFSDAELNRLINVIELLRDKLLFRFLIVTGRRVGEILQLKMGDIDFDGKMINWHIEKKHLNKSYRALKPIDSNTLALIKQYIEIEQLTKENWMFRGYKHKALTRCRVFQLTREYCEKVGITYVGNKRPHPHHFRHTFAVKIARKAKTPEDIRFLQMLLEHSTLAVTQSYMQFKQEATRQLVEQLANDIYTVEPSSTISL